LDAGQTDVMIDMYDRPVADFRDTESPAPAQIDDRCFCVVGGVCKMAGRNE